MDDSCDSEYRDLYVFENRSRYKARSENKTVMLLGFKVRK